MAVKLTIDDAQKKIFELGLKFTILEYKPSGQKSKFIHHCGYIFETKLSHLLKRNRCPSCDGVWRNKDMFQKKSNDIHNSEYEIIDFISGNKPVRIKHIKCGSIFKQMGYKHLSGNRCSSCYGNKKLTKFDIVERSKKIWNSEYVFLSENIDYNKKTLIRHIKCGYEYEQLTSSHLLGYACPKCSGNAPLTKEIVQSKSDKIHNFEYDILSDPNGSFSKIKIRHRKCGKIFNQVVSDHLSGCGCNICNQSKFENYIEQLLIENSINYDKQRTFDDCKFKNKLKFDFYLPDYNACIEFDGIQHFKPIRFFGGQRSFELQKIKDNIKTNYCISKDIKLFRFKYDDDPTHIKLTLISDILNFS